MINEPRPDRRGDTDDAPGGESLAGCADGSAAARTLEGGPIEDPVFSTMSFEGPVGPPVAAEGPGSVVGPYKLLRRIGEGGMGVVYLAEQTSPIRREVAVKIIKPGMDSGQVIARFEAERQALAMMDHPNIAKVLDAGATKGRRARPPLLRHGAGQGRADHASTATRHGWHRASGSSCSSPSARRSSMRIRRGSSTATSSRPTCWSRSTTAGRCRR